MLRPLKSHLPYEKQLQQLIERGLVAHDPEAALQLLEHLGYYRVSGYFYPLRRTKPVGQSGRLDEFSDGATFELISELAQFDKKLRLLALDAIESIEVSIRVAIAYRLGKISPEAHLKPELLDGRFTKMHFERGQAASEYEKWCDRFQKICENSKEDFVKHHKADYQGRMPIWVAVELWDFGLLSRFFSGMQLRDQNAIAALYGAIDGPTLASWLRSFNFVRNVTAHHSRLWNRTLPEAPRLPAREKCRLLELLHQLPRRSEKIFGALTCMQLLLRKISPHSGWQEQLKLLVQTFPETELLTIESAGFFCGWERSAIWN